VGTFDPSSNVETHEGVDVDVVMRAIHYLIIGNGAAGVTAAEMIRRRDSNGEITIIGAEPYPMYSRPGLAYVLNKDIPKKQVVARRLEWYAEHGLNLVFGTAVRLDVGRQKVQLEDGRVLPYDRLLISTGARATPAPYSGADLAGVVYLDTMDGTQELIQRARRRRRAVVIGGGITALELAEGLAHRGVKTHYFLRRNRLWSKVFNESEAELLEGRMRSHGVNIHYNTEITKIWGKRGSVRGVSLKNGEDFSCNLVGVAVGVQPQIDLVRGTPVQIDRAVVVNEFMESSVPNVYAAGDCAQVYDRWTQQHMLDVLWPSAVAEGRAAGFNMSGERIAYVKKSPFNACLLFGLHITTIGQINPRQDVNNGSEEVMQHLSRGSSEVWFTFPRHYDSAWSQDGPNTIRLVMNGHYLVGALIIGDQSLADPLRHIIENRNNVRDLLPYLRAGGTELKLGLERFWHQLTVSHLN
jgi:NAD(P)H-nitrite reductase large subunit